MTERLSEWAIWAIEKLNPHKDRRLAHRLHSLADEYEPNPSGLWPIPDTHKAAEMRERLRSVQTIDSEFLAMKLAIWKNRARPDAVIGG